MACGGGGGGGSVASAEGAYEGTLTGGTSDAFQLIILENGDRFTSGDARDFGTVPSTSGSIASTFVEGRSIEGTVSASGRTISFSGEASPEGSYDYNAPATLETITGDWDLFGLDGSRVAVSIGANGTFASASAGCSFSGAFAPRASGKNVFDVTVTFGPAPCDLPGQTATGIGISSLPTGTGTNQLIVGLVDASRQLGIMLFGNR